MKPVRLPASATLALPRWGLYALCLLYILPGLIGRDPWKNDDAAGFGIMWTMAHGGLNDWLLPNIVGLPMPNQGPLAFWIGAICIKLFGWLLGDPLAARISTIGFFLLGAVSVWSTTYLLGRRSEAQPLKLAFGGQPEAKDFGRTLADGALLIYIGCLGLLLRSHETSPEALFVSLIAFLLYAGIKYLETPRIGTASLIGIALGALILTRGWIAPLGLWLTLLILCQWLTRNPGRTTGHLLLAFAAALALSAPWLLLARWIIPFGSIPFSAWMDWNYSQVQLPDLYSFTYFFRYGIWFFWPAWPFAAWAVYAWRHQHKAFHIALPLAFFVGLAVLALLSPNSEENVLLPLLPPLAILAAFGLPTMKRGTINAVDWFSVMTLTTCAAFIWIGWVAKQTGWPAQLAKNAFKLAPGFKPEFNLLAVIVAALATAGWIALVHWRLSRRPSVLWRAVVLSSGGVILCWLLLMTLWMPWINYGKSYAGVAQQIAQNLPAQAYCVDTNIGAPQRASFAYLGNVRFAGFDGKRCDFLLLQDNPYRTNDAPLFKQFTGRWHLQWEGRRPSDRDERFRLYQRIN